MKKILLAALVLFLIGTITTQAANVSVNLVYDTVANTVSQVVNAASGVFRASSFTATSTTQTNTFPQLTSTNGTTTGSLGIGSANQFKQHAAGFLDLQRGGADFTLMRIRAPRGTSKEATLSLVNDMSATDAGTSEEFVDIYNENYGDSRQWGMRQAYSGTGQAKPFIIGHWNTALAKDIGNKLIIMPSGTVAVAQATSTIPSTTAFYVASSTSPNLVQFDAAPGTTRFVVQNGGNVGIGTTTNLAAKLNIQANTGVAAINIASSSGTTTFAIDGNGNTMFGTAIAAIENGINSFVSFISTTGNDAYVTFKNVSASKAMALRIRAESNFAHFDIVTPSVSWLLGNFGATDFSIYDGSTNVGVLTIQKGNTANRLTIDSVGKVGIATSSPSALFTVAGDMRLTGRFADSASSTGAVGSVLTATANGTQWLATSSLGLGAGGGSGTVNSGNTNQIAFYNATGTAVSGTSTITIRNEQVGIGTTTPTSMLTVAGDISVKTGSFIRSGLNIIFGGNGFNTLFRPDSSGGDMQMQSFAGAVNTTFKDNGSVGIGSTTPNSSLAIQSLVGVNPFQIASSSGAVLFNVFPTGNVAIGTTSTTSLDTNSARLLIDMGVSNPAQEAILVRGNVNDFLEGNIKNQSTGAAAQACWTSTTDTGSSTSGFVSMCSNNSNFNNPQPYNVGGQGDTSLMGLSTGDMYLVNGTASKSLSFLTGGVSTSTNNRMTITGAGLVGIGTTTPSDRLTVVVGNNQGIEVQSSNSGFIGYGKIGADRWRMQNEFTNVGLFEILYNNGAGGPAGTSLLTLTGTGSGIAGRMGLNNQAPGANLEIRSVEGQGNTVALLKIATSSVATSQLFSVFATSTLQRHSSALSYFQDNGARVQVGISGYYGRTDTLDTFVVSGTIRQHGWVTSNCPALTGAVAIVADGLTGCEGYSFYEDNADGTLTATAGSGYTYSRMAVGALTLAGSGVFVNGASAGWMRLGTSTPSYEARVRISNITAWATSTAAYIGYTNTASAGTAFEVEPTAGCYFTASSTQANYLAVSATGGARTFTDTTIASTTVAGTGGGQWYMMRVDADAAGCRFFMRESESAVLRQVAYHTTNLPTAIDLNTGVHIGRGAATLNPSIDIMTLDTQWRVMLPLN